MKKISINKPNMYTIALALIGLFCVYVLFAVYILFLLGALRSEGVNSVFYDGTEYSIKRNVIIGGDKEISPFFEPIKSYNIISLAGFYNNVKSDPLFVDEYIDKEFLASLLVTKKYHNLIKNKLNLKDDFIPFDFLENIEGVLAKYQSFLSHPTKVGANELLVEYDHTNQSYLNSIQTLKKNIQSNSENLDKVLSATGGGTTPRVILSDLSLMEKNSLEIKNEINKKRNLLNGLVNYRPITRYISNPSKDKNIDNSAILAKEDIFVLPDIVGDIQGPYYVRTKCFENGDIYKAFYTYLTDFNERKIFVTKYAKENYYYEANDRKYPLIPVPDNRAYNCNDQGYQVDLLTLSNYFKEFPTEILDKVPNAISEKIKEEASIYKDERINSFYIQVLADIYTDAYYKTDDYQYKEELLKRVKYIKNKSSSLSYLYNETFDTNSVAMAIMSGASLPEKEFIYTIRSVYSLVYLNFSKATWRLDSNPQYLESENSHMDKKKYTDLINIYSKKDIRNWSAEAVEVISKLKVFENSNQ